MTDIERIIDLIEGALEGSEFGFTTGFENHCYAKVTGSDGKLRDYIITVAPDPEGD